MNKTFLIVGFFPGSVLTDQELNGIMDTANKVKELGMVGRVTLSYAGIVNTQKVKRFEEVFEKVTNIEPVNLGGFSCLNKKPAQAFGFNEAVKYINSMQSSNKMTVNVLIVDAGTRGTKEDPIPQFLQQFGETEVLLDSIPVLKAVEETLEEVPVSVTQTTETTA